MNSSQINMNNFQNPMMLKNQNLMGNTLNSNMNYINMNTMNNMNMSLMSNMGMNSMNNINMIPMNNNMN